MSSTSTMRRKRIGSIAGTLAASAALSVAPMAPVVPVLSGPTRDFVSGQCRSAAVSVGEPGSAAREVRPPPDRGTRGPAPIVVGVTEWQSGPVPGRYVALLDATVAGRPARIRAVVVLRQRPCRLVSWAYTD